jgi:hypothetical protein
MSRYQPATEYAKQIREDLKVRFPGLKFSVKSDYNSIGISLMQAPKSPFVAGLELATYRQVSHFYIGDSEVLNEYGKEIFKGVNEIVKRYHWDESRAEVDYFCCSFYYNLNVGRWDKAFEVKVKR